MVNKETGVSGVKQGRLTAGQGVGGRALASSMEPMKNGILGVEKPE